MLLNDRDQIIAMTAEWTGERYPNGRPRVSDEKIEILKNLTQEEIWQPLYSCGYRFQFQGDLKPLHPDKKAVRPCCDLLLYAPAPGPAPACVQCSPQPWLERRLQPVGDRQLGRKRCCCVRPV